MWQAVWTERRTERSGGWADGRPDGLRVGGRVDACADERTREEGQDVRRSCAYKRHSKILEPSAERKLLGESAQTLPKACRGPSILFNIIKGVSGRAGSHHSCCDSPRENHLPESGSLQNCHDRCWIAGGSHRDRFGIASQKPHPVHT